MTNNSLKKEMPLVSICTITYNHKNYIAQAIESFLMQKTNFLFEILIHDDASTDGTTEIIKDYEKKYPSTIKAIYEEENQWIKGRRGSSVFNFPRAKGKYIAICEGDDYWTDPFKLQKQVDFLEANGEYSFVCGRFLAKNQQTGEELLFYSYDKRSDVTLKNVWDEWKVQTLTVVFRKENINIVEFRQYKYFCDMHLYYSLLKKSKGCYLPEVYGVQNVNTNGVYSHKGDIERHFFLFNARKDLWQYNKTDVALKQKVFYAVAEVFKHYHTLYDQSKKCRWYYFKEMIKTISSFNDVKHTFKILLFNNHSSKHK